MARGGKRMGAGRPIGAVQRVTREARAKATAAGVTPLDYMLCVMRDSGADEKRRDTMAQAAAPYIHPKLASIEHSNDPENPMPGVSLGAIELARELAFLLRQASEKSK